MTSFFKNALRNEEGVTLIEIIIVVTCIGLLVTVTIGGQAIVEQARISNIVTAFQGYNTLGAVFQFHCNGNIPGDAPAGDCIDDRAIDADFIGNGNGTVENTEIALGFLQISAAGIPGYNFVVTTNGGYATQVYPQSQAAENAYFAYTNSGNTMTNGFQSDATLINTIALVHVKDGLTDVGQKDSAAFEYKSRITEGTGAVTLAQAQALDEKFDDGTPALGKYVCDGDSQKLDTPYDTAALLTAIGFDDNNYANAKASTTTCNIVTVFAGM